MGVFVIRKESYKIEFEIVLIPAIFEYDTLIESPAQIVHSLSNDSELQMRILLLKAPRPEDKTKLL
ncbi:MAG: hypothetical protein K9H49_13340 [Bacteroidales bacterium]|nr:hypothetical protein [Bacteroidales bacterium]